MAAAPTFNWRGIYDENLPLPEHLTLEQYRRVIFRPDAHFVDGRIRVCDLVVLQPNAPRENVPTVAPLLCAEILAPIQSPNRRTRRPGRLPHHGRPNIWLIDPIRCSAFTYDATGLHEANPTQLAVAATPIHLDLTEAFAALD